jgi:hypothetical protein
VTAITTEGDSELHYFAGKGWQLPRREGAVRREDEFIVKKTLNRVSHIFESFPEALVANPISRITSTEQCA